MCGEHMVGGRVVIFAQHDDAGGSRLWRFGYLYQHVGCVFV